MTETPFRTPIAEQIWDMKYRLKEFDGTPIDETVQHTWRRIAKALAEAEEPQKRSYWQGRFYKALESFKFIPAGRINAGAGSDRDVTLFNCLGGETELPTSEGVFPISELAGSTVKVLDGGGEWTPSKVNYLGEQPLAEVTLRGGYNGRVKKTIRATKGHRWILSDNSEKTTEELTEGLALKKVNRTLPDRSSRSYRLGVVHGVIYGDGTKPKYPLDSYSVRLCGSKVELAEYFHDPSFSASISSPPSFGEDLLVNIKSDRDMKDFPPVLVSVEYILGFLHGWFATDGCVCSRDKRPMLSCTKEGLNFLKKYGHIAGMEVNYASRLTDTTNFGTRNVDIYNVSFTRWTMLREDFLMAHHRDNFGEQPNYMWIVDSVGEYGEPEPVYCPRVETTDSVQLTMGIHTGQCFVMGTIPDSMDGIFTMLREAALTMQQGGGIGYDFSTIRPKGHEVKGVAADASGPLTFMDVWDAMCRTVMSAGSRRGAMMATMRCDHPDIEDFVEAKRDPNRLRMFNMSVLVTDEFMQAVKHNQVFDLKFDGKVVKTIHARSLWDKIMMSTYNYAEPGVIFIDRINKMNNLNYLETIASTNPCGEQPLPPYGACLLGSINLVALLDENFQIDEEVLSDTVKVAVRMMDNVVDVSKFPIPQQEAEAKAKRRIGLGVTGLASTLALAGITYGSEEAVHFTSHVMKKIAVEAYRASCLLAEEKGSFPLLDVDPFLASGNMQNMPQEIRDLVREKGIRNALLTSIAPTGTISLYAGNVSSGIEPIFALEYDRKVLEKDGSHHIETVRDYSVTKWRSSNEGELPSSFVTAQTLAPSDHVKMQAAAQRWVDSSISKTVNCPEDISFDEFKAVYMEAWDTGCKGCTTYRPNEVTGSVLEAKQVETVEDEGGACELKFDEQTGQLIRSCE